MAEDFENATRSAALGGNTMVMPFCLQPKGASIRETLKGYHALADGKCYVDVSFHLIISDPSPAVLGQGNCRRLVEYGYTSYKVFITYQDLALSDFESWRVHVGARDRRPGRGPCGELRRHPLPERLAGAGRQTAPQYHATSRPIPVEREAAYRAISLAQLINVPIMIVHVSDGEAMEEIRRARGLKIYG